jgi:hypothetical protein
MPIASVVDKSKWNTPEHFLAVLQKQHAVTCNLLVQRDKFAKKLEEKLAKNKKQDALAKTEKMKTKHREEKKGFGLAWLQTKTS